MVPKYFIYTYLVIVCVSLLCVNFPYFCSNSKWDTYHSEMNPYNEFLPKLNEAFLTPKKIFYAYPGKD